MKKIMIFILILLLPLVSAECPPDCDYTDSGYVNSLEPQNLAAAIQNGEISDYSIINDAELSNALEENPSISPQIPNNDLTRAVNSDLSLLEDSQIMDDINIRAQQNTMILNDNPLIKLGWFEQKGITDQGTKIESYDGSIVKTKGSEATTFNINSHPGATVTEEGKLILSDGTQISSAEVMRSRDGAINVKGGDTIILTPSNTNMHITDGNVQIGYNTYSSDSDIPIDVSITDGIVSITGEDVVETDVILGEIFSRFTGTVTEQEGYKELSGETEYTSYSNWEESKTYTVDDLTEYRTSGSCDGSTSCIQFVSGDLRVVSKSGNNIDVGAHDASIKNLVVDKIIEPGFEEDTTVTFNYKGLVEMTFSERPVTIKGDIRNLPEDINIYNTFEAVSGNEYAQHFNSEEGVISQNDVKLGSLIYYSNAETQPDESGFWDYSYEEVITELGEIPESGDNLIVGTVYSSEQKALSIDGNYQDYTDSTIFTGIYKIPDHVIDTSETETTTFSGIGETTSEAIINALEQASQYKGSRVDTTTILLAERTSEHNAEWRVHNLYVDSTSIITNYKLLDSKRKLTGAKYEVDVEVTLGEIGDRYISSINVALAENQP